MSEDEWLKEVHDLLNEELDKSCAKHLAYGVAEAIKAEAKHNLQVSTANCLRQSASEHFYIIEPNHAYHYIANPLGQFFLVQSLKREQATALLKQKP